MQDLVPPRPADTASTSPGDLIAGYEAHLTPLIHARFGAGEPEQVGRLRADALDALVCGRTLAERLMPTRRVTAAATPPHGTSKVSLAAALGLEIEEVAARKAALTGRRPTPAR